MWNRSLTLMGSFWKVLIEVKGVNWFFGCFLKIFNYNGMWVAKLRQSEGGKADGGGSVTHNNLVAVMQWLNFENA